MRRAVFTASPPLPSAGASFIFPSLTAAPSLLSLSLPAVECPSNKDPLGGQGGAEGRDCSGRGVCDYTTGTCVCSSGYFGEACDVQFNFY